LRKVFADGVAVAVVAVVAAVAGIGRDGITARAPGRRVPGGGSGATGGARSVARGVTPEDDHQAKEREKP
jgi:hypothetical protein